MSRLFAIDIACYFEPKATPFVEFIGFDSYLEKFGLDVRASVLVWRLDSFLNLDGSLDLRLIARPSGWTAEMIDYWSSLLLNSLMCEAKDEETKEDFD